MNESHDNQGNSVARVVHVGSSAPSPYASVPTLCMHSFLVYPAYYVKALTCTFYYTVTASNKYADTFTYTEEYLSHY